MAIKLTRAQAKNIIYDHLHPTGADLIRWVNLFVALELIEIEEEPEALQARLDHELRCRYFSGDQLDALQQALNAVGAKIVEK